MADCIEIIRTNLSEIRERIRQACKTAGRRVDEVTLIAVTKYADLEWVRALVELGVTDLGENRPQQLAERAPLLPPTVRWHMIGHLQRNKVKSVLQNSNLIHSADSLKLIERIDRIACDLDQRPQVLVEVNTSGESSKDGFESEFLISKWDSVVASSHIRLAGLMTMAPIVKHTADTRAYFARLRQLLEQLQARCPQATDFRHLSMGMSGDFEEAIREGATMIRVGSRLFEGLKRKHS